HQQGPFHAELPADLAGCAVAVPCFHPAEAIPQCLRLDILDVVSVAYMLFNEGTFLLSVDVAATLIAWCADDEHAARFQRSGVTAQRRFVLQDVLHHIHAYYELEAVRLGEGGHITHFELHLGATDRLKERVAIRHLLLLHVDGCDAPLAG